MEEVAIRAYGVLDYGSGWTLLVDRVPLAVALAKPAVIFSLRDAGLAITGGDRVRSVARTAAFALLDGALLEAVAVHAGLWHWTIPGPFGVPLLLPLAWSFFAWASCIALLTRRPSAALWVAPLATHALVFGAWWGAFRWFPVPEEPWAAGVACLACGWVAFRIARKRPSGLAANAFTARLAVLVFAATLLLSGATPGPTLLAWCAGWAAPWVALLARGRRDRSG